MRRLADRDAVDFTVLKAEGGYLLKTVALDGRGAIVAGGNDPAGTMYAAYELLERLGIVFQLSNDVVPERKPTLDLPELPSPRAGSHIRLPAWKSRRQST